MKKIFIVELLSAFLLFSNSATSQSDSEKDSILSYTQQLVNGIADGDTTAWAKYLDDSCIITSEDAR